MHEVYLADMPGTSVDGDEPGDAFQERHLSISGDQVFAEVEAEIPLIPSTLTSVERAVLVRMYLDFNQRDIGAELGSDAPRSRRRWTPSASRWPTGAPPWRRLRWPPEARDARA